MGSLHAQGWSVFCSSIEGNHPSGALMLSEQYGFVFTQKGLYRTTDGGKNWLFINGGPWGYARDQFYYYTPSNIFVRGEYESKDSGITWQQLPHPAPSGFIYIHDSTIYDASGIMSTDHFQSWKSLNNYPFANYPTGEIIIGNHDKGIAIWGGSQGKHYNKALLTIDGGKNWYIGANGVEADYGYAIPYTPTYFRAGGDGADEIQRSVDGGTSWQTVWGPVNTHYLSDGIAGDGCIEYVQTMSTLTGHIPGVMQSVNGGQYWREIGGPIAESPDTDGDDYPLCGVTSRGSVCFAMDYLEGPLWKFSDHFVSILRDTKIKKSFTDTLIISLCDSVKLNLNLNFSACDFIRFQEIGLSGIDSEYYRISFQKDQILRSGVQGNAFIQILPSIPGIYHLSVNIHLAASDWSGSDTTFPLILIVKPNPPTLVITKNDTINFGTKQLCLSGGQDSLVLSNPGCNFVAINNIRLETDSSSNSEFTIISTVPDTLRRDKPSNKIIVNFHPQNIGNKTGKIIIVSDSKVDTIFIYANVLEDNRELKSRCDSIVSQLCDSTEGLLHLYNLTCWNFSLDSLSLQNPYQLLNIKFPVLIAVGDSILLPIRFVPLKRNANSILAKGSLRFFQANDTIKFDTTVILTGFATHGPSAYTLSSASLTFDTLHLCDSAKRRVVLYSTGCDSLSLGAISVSGDPDFQVSGIGVRASEIATGDSVVLNVSLNPISIGNKSATITIILNDSSKIIIPINGIVTRAIRTLTTTAKSILDFGKHYTCDNNDTTITITNPSCAAVQVLGVGFQGSGFGTNTNFPITIPPGGSTDIDVHNILDTSGGKSINSSMLTIVSDADNSIAPINFIISYILPHSVHLWLDADKTPHTAGSIWRVKLKGLLSELSDVRTIDLVLNFNSDLISYFKQTGTNSTTSSTNGKTFSISGSPMILAGADSTITELDFNVYLTKDTMTSIALGNIVLNSGDPKFMECVAIPLATGIDFAYSNTCGDPSIRNFMLGKQIEMSIHPNPAQDELEIHLQSQMKQNASIEIRNALGVQMYSGANNLISGLNSIHIDTKNLSEGMYFVRVTSPNGSVSQNFVKVK
jgi:hypothetical protein